MRNKSKIISIIMGGGRGTRLSPLTQERCKPAVPLAGKYRLVDIPISNCLNSGYNKIFILTQFNTASLHQHIQESYKFDPFGGGCVDILAAEQTETGNYWYQGTADAVRQNLHHYNVDENDLIIILSGDQLYRMDLSDVVRQHRETEAELTIAAKAMPINQVEGLGLMRVNDDKEILEFVEKPTDPEIIQDLAISRALKSGLNEAEDIDYTLVNMGIYVFNKKTLFEALNNDHDDFGKEIIPTLLGKIKMYSYIFNGYWEDIGTVRSFFNANLSLTDTNPPFNFFDEQHPVYTRARYLPASKINHCKIDRAIIAGGCILEDARIERCVIGVRSRIADDTYLENVIMMGSDYFESDEQKEENRTLKRPDLGIGKNCGIRNAIVDKNARIGNNVTLDPQGKEDGHYLNDQVVIRDGILIVTKNGIIPDNSRL